MDKQTRVRNKKKKKFKAWKVVLITIILAILISLGAGAGIVMAYINTAPPIDLNSFTQDLSLTTNIYDKDGKYIESLHGIENRTYAPLSKIKKYTQDAFIAIEDERFEDHFGIDVKRIFGALLADIKSGRAEQGASTITQQLIKNTLLTSDKTLKRKIQEAYLAIQLDKQLSKDLILEYYLNTIFLGGSAYGVQAASEYYFDKDVEQLTIAESALIAGLTQSPYKYNPYSNEETPEIYKDRTNLVLSKMLEHNMITQEEYDNALTELSTMKFTKRNDNTTLKYQWFVEAAIDSITSDLKAKNYSDDEITQMIYRGGLKIYTTIDTKVQDVVDKVSVDPKYYPDPKKMPKGTSTWGKDNTIQPQIAIVITDYKTGQVRAVEGARGQMPLRSVNRATDPKYAKQPGSSMKPLAVYGPAFDLGYSPGTVIDDAPLTPEMLAAAGYKFELHDYNDSKYKGLTTIRDAVRDSLNVVAVKLIMKIGTNTSTNYIKKFGISTLATSGKYNDAGAAKALGALTHGVTPLEMSAAYGVFGNGGTYVQPILYTKVLDKDGNILLEKKQDKHQVISPQAAYLTTNVLENAVKTGTGSWVRSKAKFTSTSAAGKTGTTEVESSAYFAGYTWYYSGAIWMGHDKQDTEGLKLSSNYTAWMWGDIMKQIHEGLPAKEFERPEGLVEVAICKDSGKLPTDLCAKDPRGNRVVTELFKEGTEPKESCDVHVSALIDTRNGKLASEYTPAEYIKEGIFIKKPEPTTDTRVKDLPYQVPTEISDLDSSGSPTEPTQEPSPGSETSPTPTPSSKPSTP